MPLCCFHGSNNVILGGDGRSNEEVQRSTALKDAMRDNCLDELVGASIQLTGSLHSSNPDLAAAILEAIARYVNWIDIGLVANDRYRILYSNCRVSLLLG